MPDILQTMLHILQSNEVESTMTVHLIKHYFIKHPLLSIVPRNNSFYHQVLQLGPYFDVRHFDHFVKKYIGQLFDEWLCVG